MLANIKKNVKFISKREGKTEYFFSHILVPLWVLTFYFLSFSRLLPEGVNNTFMTRSGEYAVWLTGALSLIFIAIIILGKRKISFSLKSEEKFSKKNLLFLLLPLTPVMQYLLNNLDILSTFDAISLFLIFTVFVAFFVLFVPTLFKRIGSSQILMFLGLAFTFSILNMGTLSQQFSWHEAGSLRTQLAVFVVIFLLCWIFFYAKNQKILYALVVIVFLSNTITQFSGRTSELSEADSAEASNELLHLVNAQKPVLTPSIYLLIYDAYVINETMLSYGINNQPQEKYLEELGFQIYPHTYSIGARSINTMSRVLNASTEFYGINRRAVSGDGVVQNLLNEFGYKTYGIFPSDYFFQGTIAAYDYSFPNYISETKYLLAEAIFTGEFRFDIGFDTVSREQFIEEKNNLFSEDANFPKFIYMHSSRPGHSQNSGKCRPNEVELYNKRLSTANLEMKEDIKMLLENDPDAIIIIAGDHGSYLTKNCFELSGIYDISEITRLDIQDRYGTFLAIRWPTQGFEEYDDIVVLQDLFPAVFAYMFQDPNLLEARVDPVTVQNDAISEAKVIDGIIEGGIHDGEPLFIGRNK